MKKCYNSKAGYTMLTKKLDQQSTGLSALNPTIFTIILYPKNKPQHHNQGS